jgi:dihydrofolate synthase/folylpolyglutamate synthase
MRPLADWLAHQQAQHPNAIELGLERVREVAARLGVLPWRIPTVLVAGTNGKGSTVACLTELARASGLRAGTYTSPHLQQYNERIALEGAPVGDALLIETFERIEQARGTLPLTFFEYGTLAAYLIFETRRVEVAIVEVGLGGRLDATNIIDADVAVITSIGLDHMDWLGPTVEHIGREKAGICRAGHPVILGTPPWPASVREVIAALGCPVRELGVDFEPVTRLVGPARPANGAAALSAFETLLEHRPDLVPRQPLDRTACLEAMRHAAPRGRFQRVQHAGCEWILDVAHNADSARVLAEALRTLPPARTLGVVGILGDKDATAIGEFLAPVVDEWVLCGLEGARGCDAETLRSRLPSQVRSVALVADVPEGCATACALAEPGNRIVVLGSFTVVGPALDWLRIQFAPWRPR